MAHELPHLPVPSDAKPTSGTAKWMLAQHNEQGHHADHTWPWWRVIWLTGVDYFSTLGYQPGIALLAAGALAPAATVILVLVTLFGALPIYAQVARRSYGGEGSIAMIERLLPGWTGKTIVLAMIGFAATDFVITMTLSAADAAEHAVHNPLLHHYLAGMQLPVTILLLAALAAVFLKGFKEAIGLATWLAIPYLVLNGIITGRGLQELMRHPELLANWRAELPGDPTQLFIASALTFPQLALGLSGFETGVSVMPLVRGEGDEPGKVPEARVRNTRKLLTGAAVIMSLFLVSTSLVTTCLITPEEYASGGKASGRALAFLAHKYLGAAFGSAYDLSTLLILWFAGASAMAAMLSLVPRYLPRFGMAPHWVRFTRPLVLLLFAIDVVVTVVFDANVEAQGGAYATGVLALILSASLAVTIATWREGRRGLSVYFGVLTAVFAYTLGDNILLRPDGIIISSIFISAIVLIGALSRYLRATEFRVDKITFDDEESEAIWPEMVNRKVHLVALRWDPSHVKRKKREIQKNYKVSGAFAFVHVELGNDRSRFDTELKVHVRRRGEDYYVRVVNAVAVANTIAYLSEQLDPISLFLGLTRGNPMSQALKYLMWGEGETGIVVYQILLRYWAWTPEHDRQPAIFLMSERVDPEPE